MNAHIPTCMRLGVIDTIHCWSSVLGLYSVFLLTVLICFCSTVTVGACMLEGWITVCPHPAAKQTGWLFYRFCRKAHGLHPSSYSAYLQQLFSVSALKPFEVFGSKQSIWARAKRSPKYGAVPLSVDLERRRDDKTRASSRMSISKDYRTLAI